jgi:EAL domain-containing protein (putative c-di-GMP-specific phosphodiesterase class I)
MKTASKQNASRVAKSYGAAEVREAITIGKLVNYYQSKVDVTTREVVGVETLARWFHPQDGMV